MKCKCSDRCGFKADETGYNLFHDPDPTPERLEARTAALTERGRVGGAKRAANAAKSVRRACSLRDVPALLAELEGALLLVSGAAGDKIQRAGAIVKIVSEARSILMSDAEKNAARIEKLLADNPELARRLRSVK